VELDDLLRSRNARPRKVRRKGVRSFLCSRSARPQKGLARRPQSKTSHTLASSDDELGEGSVCARNGGLIQAALGEWMSELGRTKLLDVFRCADVQMDWDIPENVTCCPISH
jgi:hypothetical protein